MYASPPARMTGMSDAPEALRIATDTLTLEASDTPWDSQIFGFPVARIDHLRVSETPPASISHQPLLDWIARYRYRLLSCRLAHTRVAESMFLESLGFNFIESLLHPQLTDLQRHTVDPPELSISAALPGDVADLQRIARTAFRDQRHHLDPRLDSARADERYAHWVGNSIAHPTQQLIKISDGAKLVAFFVIERNENRIYWHLNAVAPQWQGQGYGKRAWRSMLAWHQQQGVEQVTTSISVTNLRVLNLYARLGFRFLPAEMTFHWMPQA